jgi:hypothetical protein
VGHVGRVEGEATARDGPGPQRADAGVVIDAPEALKVPPQGPGMGQELVGQEEGLGPLEVGVARDHGSRVLLRSADQGELEAVHAPEDGDRGFPEPEPFVQGHLVVPTPGGVEALGGVPHELAEPRLHVGMDVLQLLVEGEHPLHDLPMDGPEAPGDGGSLRRLQDPRPGQHGRVGEAPKDIGFCQAPVEGQGGDEPAPGEGEGFHFFAQGPASFALPPARAQVREGMVSM